MYPVSSNVFTNVLVVVVHWDEKMDEYLTDFDWLVWNKEKTVTESACQATSILDLMLILFSSLTFFSWKLNAKKQYFFLSDYFFVCFEVPFIFICIWYNVGGDVMATIKDKKDGKCTRFYFLSSIFFFSYFIALFHLIPALYVCSNDLCTRNQRKAS